MGELIGAMPAFISPGHARELALTPGTIFHRVLTDPADGRLIERSTRAYRPDAAMRRQIHAADRYSRAPGSRQPAASCELDHVTPWATHTDCHPAPPTTSHGRPGGVEPPGQGSGPDSARCPDPGCGAGLTTETNLATLGARHHQLKTARRLHTVINTRRDLSFTTLLGTIATTRVHDYRQYLPPPGHPEKPDTADPDTPDPDPGRDLHPWANGPDLTPAHDHANQTLHAALTHALNAAPTGALTAAPTGALSTALTHRGPREHLAAPDDAHNATEHGGPLGSWIWLSYHRRTTANARGTDPTAPETQTRKKPSPQATPDWRPGNIPLPATDDPPPF